VNVLLRVFGLPHEALHVVALWLIGRRAVQFTMRHVIIPDDLSTRAYLFVAGFPGAVFALILCMGAVALFNTVSIPGLFISVAAILIGGFGVASALGDFDLMIARLQERNEEP
jgi:hypothetical protein